MAEPEAAQRARRYTPVCETCNAGPKMDRCDCCEECWYSGRYSREQAWKSLSPAERRRALDYANRNVRQGWHHAV